MEEQRRAAAAARQEIKEDKKPKKAAAGPAPSMALRTAASLQRALSNDDEMFWEYAPAVTQRAGMKTLACSQSCCCFQLCRGQGQHTAATVSLSLAMKPQPFGLCMIEAPMCCILLHFDRAGAQHSAVHRMLAWSCSTCAAFYAAKAALLYCIAGFAGLKRDCIVLCQAIHTSSCHAGNRNTPPLPTAKQAAQTNGRPAAGQQWQSPQTSPHPPPSRPMPQEIPASSEAVKMSSEFKVQPDSIALEIAIICLPNALVSCLGVITCYQYVLSPDAALLSWCCKVCLSY